MTNYVAHLTWTQPLSWTPTDAAIDEAIGYTTSKTWTGRAIGSASATRQVVVAALVQNESTTSLTLSCTIGGVSATKVTEGLSHPTATGSALALFIANITTGTTANIVVTLSTSTVNKMAIAVGVLDGVNATASSVATAGQHPADINSPYAAGSSMTIPASGIGLAVGGANTSSGTMDFSNFTKDATASIAGSTLALAMGHNSTAGAITPTATYGNFAQEVTLGAAWGP